MPRNRQGGPRWNVQLSRSTPLAMLSRNSPVAPTCFPLSSDTAVRASHFLPSPQISLKADKRMGNDFQKVLFQAASREQSNLWLVHSSLLTAPASCEDTGGGGGGGRSQAVRLSSSPLNKDGFYGCLQISQFWVEDSCVLCSHTLIAPLAMELL